MPLLTAVLASTPLDEITTAPPRAGVCVALRVQHSHYRPSLLFSTASLMRFAQVLHTRTGSLSRSCPLFHTRYSLHSRLHESQMPWFSVRSTYKSSKPMSDSNRRNFSRSPLSKSVSTNSYQSLAVMVLLRMGCIRMGRTRWSAFHRGSGSIRSRGWACSWRCR